MTANAVPARTDSTSQNVSDDFESTAPILDKSQVPYSQSLSALLDVYYRNDAEAFVALGLGTAEEASLLYNTVLDSELRSMDLDTILGWQCPESLKNDFRAFIASLLGSVRYAVTDCEGQPDGTYKITVIYEKVIFLDPARELFFAVIEDLAKTWLENPNSAPSKEEMNLQMLAALYSSMKACLENITYAEPAITTISVIPQDNIYLPDINDIIHLERLLFEYTPN